MPQKSFFALVLLLLMTAVQAQPLAPINVQNAYIDLENPNQITVGFDWFRDSGDTFPPILKFRVNNFNLPRVDYRRSYSVCDIPVRIGLNTSLSLGFLELGDKHGGELAEASAFGFNDLGLTLETAIVNKENFALTPYINQQFPFSSNILMNITTLTPVTGLSGYALQAGTKYSVSLLEHLKWYGDIAYRFDSLDGSLGTNNNLQNSLVYYNEVVASTKKFGASIGLLGQSRYSDFNSTDLRLVPGLILAINDDVQARVSMPIGINEDSPDIGLQISLYSVF